MNAKIEQTLLTINDRYYTIYAICHECATNWGWRDDDRNTTNYKDLQREVDEHNKKEHEDG